jgi:hypothetical protein
MGATTARATDLPSLRAAMGELVAARGVRLLDVAIARSVMSEVYERQHARPAQSR